MQKITLLTLAFSLSLFAKPVETERYLTGAWGYYGTPEVRELYPKAGFNMVHYQAIPPSEGDFRYISCVTGNPPKDAARPFETADGKLLNSVGLFTHVNFSAPSVEKWWREYVPNLVRKWKNADKIAFWKVHNEFGYHSSENFDYSEGSRAKYRQWLEQRYGTIADLNAKWATNWDSFAAIEPPRRDLAKQLPNWLEWRRFTAWNFARYFHDTGELVRTVVPNAKVSDNFYLTNGMDGWDLFELARQTDYMAMDIYAIERWDQLINAMDVARSAATAWNKPFLMMEYHAGPNNWIHKVYDWHLYTEALLALARESRALQWYMWNSGKAGREEGIHGILDFAGKPTERMTAVTRISAFTQRFAPLFNRARTQPKVALFRSHDSQYLQYAYGKNIWQYMTMNKIVGLLLDLQGIPYVFVDAQQTLDQSLDSFDTIILAACPVVSDAVMTKLASYAANGKTVVIHAGSAVYNEFGRPRTAVSAQFSDKPQTVKESGKLFRRYPLKSTTENAARVTIGQAPFLFCAWDFGDIPLKTLPEDRFLAMADAYGAFLKQQAKVSPSLTVTSNGLHRCKIDARLLRADDLSLLFLTKLERQATDLTVTLHDYHEAQPGWFYAPDSSTVVPLEGTLTNGDLTYRLPLGTNAGNGGVILFGHWQPVVDIASASGQDTFRPGEQTDLLVGITNLSTADVSGTVSLKLPAGWQAVPASTNSFANLPAGQRRQIAFHLTVPLDAKCDFFAFENPVTATVAFSKGVEGTLSAKMQPFVKPTLDVRVRYREQLLNDWQELTPRILRWGWLNEVVTPPPPPMSILGNAHATLCFDARADLFGKPLTLSVVHEDGTKGLLTHHQDWLPGRDFNDKYAADKPFILAAEVPVTFFLPKSGTYTLKTTVGDFSQTAIFTAAAGTETVQYSRTFWQMFGLGGVAARRAAKGTPVAIPWDRTIPEGAVCVRHPVQNNLPPTPVAFERAGNSFIVNADLPASGVALYSFHTRESVKLPLPQPRVTCVSKDSHMIVSGDSYRLTFNSAYGWIESMELKQGQNWVSFMPERTGPVLVTMDGRTVGPETSSGLTSLSYEFSNCSGALEFSRPLDGDKVEVQEKWIFEPNHIKIDLQLRNLTRAPLTYRSLAYEIGVNSQTAPKWSVCTADGALLESNALPSSGYSDTKQAMILMSPGGSSMAVTLRRCAQNMRWGGIQFNVRHQANLTQIDMSRNFSIDPGDFLLGEFDWWPSTDSRPAFGDPGLSVYSDYDKPRK